MNKEREQLPEKIELGDYELDVASGIVTKSGNIDSVRLNPKSVDLLLFLAKNHHRLVTRDQLLESVWGDRVVTESQLTKRITEIRTALEDRKKPHRYIETLPKRGYRLICDVSICMSRDSNFESVADKAGFGGSGLRIPSYRRALGALTVPGLRHLVFGGGNTTDTVSERAGGQDNEKFNARFLAGLGIFAIALSIGLGVAWWWTTRFSNEDTSVLLASDDGMHQPPVIAVLPLTDFSENHGETYMGAAVAQEIWTKLAGVSGLRLVAMTSTYAYQDSQLDIREIGNRLMADFIVEGSTQFNGSVVRVNIHLIDAHDGTEVWGTSFDAEIVDTNDLFALYDNISIEIGRQLPPQVMDLDLLAQSTKPPTDNLEAYVLLQQAQTEFLETGNPKQALELASQAIDLDPEYAEAHARFAMFHAVMSEFSYGPSLEHLRNASAAASKAIDIDPTLGNAFLVRAIVTQRLDLNFQRAMEYFHTAKALGADLGPFTGWMQDLLLVSGRYEEGEKLMRAELARSPGHGMATAQLGRFLDRLGDRDQARQVFEESLRLSPDNQFVVSNYIQHLLNSDELLQAQELINQYGGVLKPNSRRSLQARLDFRRGDPEPLKSLVEQWMSDHANPDLRSVPTTTGISNHLYILEEYELHINWIRKRVEHWDHMSWIADELRRRPDYWQNLDSWARANPEDTNRRLKLLNEHRERIERVTRNMVLR